MEDEKPESSAVYAQLAKERQKVEVMSQTVKILEREKETMMVQMGDELATEKHMVSRLEELLVTLKGATITTQVQTKDENEELTRALDAAEEEVERLTEENSDLKAEMELMVQHVDTMKASFAAQQAQALSSIQEKDAKLHDMESECEQLREENESLHEEVRLVNDLLMELRGTPAMRESIAMQYSNDRKVAEEGKKRLLEVWGQLKKLEIDYETMKKEFEQYKQETTDAHAKEKENILRLCKEECESLENIIKERDKEIEEKDADNVKLRTDREKIMALCKEECDEMAKRNEEKEAELEKLKQEKDTYSKKVEHMKSKLHQLADEYQKMEEEVKQTETMKRSMSAELTSGKRRIEELQQELEEKPSLFEVETIKSKLTETQMKAKETEAMLASLKAEAAQDIENLRQSAKETRRELKSQKKENARLLNESKNLKTENESLKEQAEELKDLAMTIKAKTMEELKERITNLESTNMQLKQDLEEMQEIFGSARTSLIGNQPSLMDEVKMALERASMRPSRISFIPMNTAQLEALRKEISEKEFELKSITAERDTLKEEVESAQRRVAILQQDIKSLGEEVERRPRPSIMRASEETGRQQREEITRLSAELKMKTQEVIQLQAQLIESKQRWADYINSLQTTLMDVEREATNVKMANAEMRTQLEEIEAQRKSAPKPKKTSFLDRIKKHT